MPQVKCPQCGEAANVLRTERLEYCACKSCGWQSLEERWDAPAVAPPGYNVNAICRAIGLRSLSDGLVKGMPRLAVRALFQPSPFGPEYCITVTDAADQPTLSMHSATTAFAMYFWNLLMVGMRELPPAEDRIPAPVPFSETVAIPAPTFREFARTLSSLDIHAFNGRDADLICIDGVLVHCVFIDAAGISQFKGSLVRVDRPDCELIRRLSNLAIDLTTRPESQAVLHGRFPSEVT